MDNFQIARERANKELQEKQQQVRQHQMRRGVGEVISRVTAHPDWKIYVDHLQAVQNALTTELESLKSRLSDTTYKAPDTLAALNFNLAVKTAELRGLTRGIDTAYAIIEQGKRSEEELRNLTN